MDMLNPEQTTCYGPKVLEDHKANKHTHNKLTLTSLALVLEKGKNHLVPLVKTLPLFRRIRNFTTFQEGKTL